MATPPRARHDALTALTVAVWIAVVLCLDAVRVPAWGEQVRQPLLGLVTWALLLHLLRSWPPVVRVQTAVVVVLATAVEYTFSPLLEAYTYRIGTVPWFVPPGHGLVYLAAFALARTRWIRAAGDTAALATAVLATAWAVYGVTLAPRNDALGAFWCLCLLGFLALGPNRQLYVGAFAVVTYLEVLGTWLGTWTWATTDPVLHAVTQGNPPSGAAGGYGWFDLYAVLSAPRLLPAFSRLSAASCRMPLLARASVPNGPSLPSSEEKRPPASVTMGTSAAMSCRASSGSPQRSTAPSASSMYDQKSP